MGTDWKSVNVKCPFYIDEDAASIKCEGMMPKSTLRQRFRNVRDKDFTKMVHCEKKYAQCPIYLMLMKYKYYEK